MSGNRHSPFLLAGSGIEGVELIIGDVDDPIGYDWSSGIEKARTTDQLFPPLKRTITGFERRNGLKRTHIDGPVAYCGRLSKKGFSCLPLVVPEQSAIAGTQGIDQPKNII